MKCSNCQATIDDTSKFCPYCGKPVVKQNVFPDTGSIGTPFNLADYKYGISSEDQIINSLIDEELNANKETNNNPTTLPIEKKKDKFTIIYAVILFICGSLFFFHSHFGWLIVAFLIATLIYFNSVKSFNFRTEIIKQVKARPDEKVKYIVSSSLGAAINPTKHKQFRVALIVGVLLLVGLIFRAPMTFYERTGDDYVVRFYTNGLFKHDKKLVIPEKHKGRNVVGIRGDVFRGVTSLREVVLPATITEIRGGAFMNARNLESINLPEGLTEIKGSTFENCSSLKEIDIPEGVIRIGGSAFRNCFKLAKATIPESVTEIGSSAFRGTPLVSVCVSSDTFINPRAFKDTGTVIYYYENGCKPYSYDDDDNGSSYEEEDYE